MDDQELEQLLEDLESDRVERKASIADGKKIRQTICAFANDLPDIENNIRKFSRYHASRDIRPNPIGSGRELLTWRVTIEITDGRKFPDRSSPRSIEYNFV